MALPLPRIPARWPHCAQPMLAEYLPARVGRPDYRSPRQVPGFSAGRLTVGRVPGWSASFPLEEQTAPHPNPVERDPMLTMCRILNLAEACEVVANLQLAVDVPYNKFNGSLPPIFTRKSSEALRFSHPLPLSPCRHLSYYRLNSSLAPIFTSSSSDLSYNKLNGTLPPIFTSSMQFLGFLHLSHNSFLGPLPSNLATCQSLYELDVSNNYLSGMVAPIISSLTSLQTLDLSSNYFTRPVPPHELTPSHPTLQHPHQLFLQCLPVTPHPTPPHPTLPHLVPSHPLPPQ
ncbi:unnamed protein product [Closterium sp. NIES-64]|nr:unnamed protein product [Closterium sp. NIES-64]